LSWYSNRPQALNQEARARAIERQNNLTKPAGSLGLLEEIAIRFSGLLGDAPSIKNPVNDPGEMPGVVREWVAPTSSNIAMQQAMTEEQCTVAMQAGKNAVQRAVERGSNIIVGGDMGIANTTAATALICAYLGHDPINIAGPGTGLDKSGVLHKAAVVERALVLHEPKAKQPIEILQSLGGFEIAALAATYIAAAQAGIVSVVDGFIASSAALAAVKINSEVGPWLQLSHRSAEPGFAIVEEALVQAGAGVPLLDFQMRLGEGSGAALVLPLLRTACRVHNEMATFAEAGVSEG